MYEDWSCVDEDDEVFDCVICGEAIHRGEWAFCVEEGYLHDSEECPVSLGHREIGDGGALGGEGFASGADLFADRTEDYVPGGRRPDEAQID